MNFEVLGDDDDKPVKKKKGNGDNFNIVEKGNNNLVIPIVFLMGLMLLGALYFAVQPCPDITCPDVNVPACPTCPACPSQNITIPQCPTVICQGSILNQTEDLTPESITIFNAMDSSINKTIYLNSTTDYYQTANLDLVSLALELGNNITIRVNE